MACTIEIKRRNFIKQNVLAATGFLLGNNLFHPGGVKSSVDPAKNVSWFPVPDGEEAAPDWTVTVDGNPVFVYAARVSAVPFNQIWPGYQRPLEQTELAGFAYWDMSGPVTVQVTCQRPIKDVIIRPTRYHIRPQVDKQTITFDLPQLIYLTVEVNGTHQALHLFPSPPETSAPDPNDPQVKYFGPGVHHPGIIQMQNNQTVYIAGGAVVYGAIQAKEARNLRIYGRGILDASAIERGQTAGAIVPLGCTDLRIEGIIIRDSNLYGVAPTGCRNVWINGIKLIGFWRYNSDGIDLMNCRDVTIERCFIRSFDDSLVIKGCSFAGYKVNHLPLQDIRITGCVVWNDWGRALEMGAETSAPEMCRVVFQNCDVIHNSYIAMDIQHGDRAAIHDITFEDIRVEVDEKNYPLLIQKTKEEKYPVDAPLFRPKLLVLEITKTGWSVDTERGTMRDIRLKDIQVLGPYLPESRISGNDAEHRVERVTLENLSHNGEKIKTLDEGKIIVTDYTDAIVIR